MEYEYEYNLKKFLEIKGSNSLTHLQLLLFRVKDIKRGWAKRYAENTVTEGEWKEAIASLNSRKKGIKLLEKAASELGTVVEVPEVVLGTGYTLERFFKHIRTRNLTSEQALLFRIDKASKGWKKRNRNKEVSEAVWNLLLETCHAKKKEGTVSENQKLYLLKNQIGMFKVGVSCDPFRRANDLANASGIDIDVLAVWDTGETSARAVETDLHRRFKPLRMRGEWFDLGEEGLRRVIASLEDSSRFSAEMVYKKTD